MEKREIKSYVIRSGRMGKGSKVAMSELLPKYGLSYPADYLKIEELSQEYEKILIEIGFGMGEALVVMAKNNSSFCYIGLEVHPPGLGRVLRELEDNKITNVRILPYNAQEAVRTMIPEAFADGFHIFFPDPWPKQRHHKRRLLQKNFLELLVKKVKPGGYIYIVTDWKDYAESIIKLSEEFKDLENSGNPYIQKKEWRPETSFELKAKAKKNPVFELFFIKKAPVNPPLIKHYKNITMHKITKGRG